MNEILSWIIIVFSVASLKLAWFNTLLPIHVFHLLHRIGFSYGIKDWSSFSEYESTREDWELFISLSKYALLTNLITCPICLSFHLSFWCSLILFTICYLINFDIFWCIIPISTFTVPYIVNKILK